MFSLCVCQRGMEQRCHKSIPLILKWHKRNSAPFHSIPLRSVPFASLTPFIYYHCWNKLWIFCCATTFRLFTTPFYIHKMYTIRWNLARTHTNSRHWPDTKLSTNESIKRAMIAELKTFGRRMQKRERGMKREMKRNFRIYVQLLKSHSHTPNNATHRL